MASLSENLVREFFELRGFLVRQPRKHTPRSAKEPEEADLLVLNPQPAKVAGELPFLLEAGDVNRLGRALVAVKGWHTEVFSPTRLEQMPEIFRFTAESVVRQAEAELGLGGGLKKVLVVPALPAARELREQSLEVMRAHGVDAALTFHTLLADLLQRVEVNRDYFKSDTLQLLRILKNYNLLRDTQLELFKPRRGGKRGALSGKG
ncbi:MAG: hypothetical protein RI897_2388 [Verrucomicrobiota bacterium]|jgi:hypothetical protein